MSAKRGGFFLRTIYMYVGACAYILATNDHNDDDLLENDGSGTLQRYNNQQKRERSQKKM